jgi:hypothetical protein
MYVERVSMPFLRRAWAVLPSPHIPKEVAKKDVEKIGARNAARYDP